MTKSEKLKKQEEEMEEEKEEEGEEEMEESSKSETGNQDEITEEDLEKSLKQLEDEVEASDEGSRKDVLLEKAKTSELDKSEKDELFELLGGEPREEETLSDEVVKSLKENQSIAEALDVSEYLEEQHTELCKSLERLSEEIEKSDNRQHQFNLVLAKAVAETGRMVKSMAERLGVIEHQPAREPKAKLSNAKPLEKSFANQKATGEQLSKSQILDGLESMLQKSVSEGRAGTTEDGIDLGVAASKFEQFSTISPSLLERVRMHIQGGGAQN